MALVKNIDIEQGRRFPQERSNDDSSSLLKPQPLRLSLIKLFAASCLALSVAIVVLLIVYSSKGLPVAQITILEFIFQLFTLTVDSLQMWFFNLEVQYETSFDTNVLRGLSLVTFAIAASGYIYSLSTTQADSSPDILALVIFASFYTIYITLVVVVFLLYVAIGFQNRFRSIRIVRPKFLTSLSKLSPSFASDLEQEDQKYIHLNHKLESVVDAMKQEYFNIADYSIFLRNRLVYALPLYSFSIVRLLLHVDLTPINVYFQIAIYQLPYYLVVYCCIQLNKEIQMFEDELKHDTDLKVRVLGVDVKHTWLISIVLSIVSVLMRIVSNQI